MPTRTWKTSLAAVARIDEARDSICSAGSTTFTLPCVDVKPGAVAVTVAVPRAPATPWTAKFASTLPLASGTSMNADPTAVGLDETRSRLGLVLVILTVMPPCAPAPSRAVGPTCRPAPTAAGRFNNVMPGALTVTVTGAAARKPGAVALTVVEPAPVGSKATPPAATEVGELDCPATTVTVRDWSLPAVVTS